MSQHYTEHGITTRVSEVDIDSGDKKIGLRTVLILSLLNSPVYWKPNWRKYESSLEE